MEVQRVAYICGLCQTSFLNAAVLIPRTLPDTFEFLNHPHARSRDIGIVLWATQKMMCLCAECIEKIQEKSRRNI